MIVISEFFKLWKVQEILLMMTNLPYLYDYLHFSFTNSLLVLPVVFTLITEEEIGEQLRQKVETELTQIGAELSVTIQIGEVERFGE